MVFDGFRRSFDDLLSRATRPEERRAVVARMKDTLVQAKVGLEDMRDGLEKARRRLAQEERELDTVRRRKTLAEGIQDQQTVHIALKYEQMHAERVNVLRQKVTAQEAEVALAQRDIESMSVELKAALAGTGAQASTPALDPSTEGEDEADQASQLRDEINSLGRARANAEREADAARRLDELKRRMGK